MKATRFSSAIYVCLLLVPAWAQQRDIEDYQPPLIEQLEATEVGRYHAQEARQGAAADADHIYAIVNFIIGQYDKTSGKLIQRWQGSRGGPIRHLNSCFAENRKLYCANSNFPEVPMASSIEVFDTGTLKHRQSLSLGILDECRCGDRLSVSLSLVRLVDLRDVRRPLINGPLGRVSRAGAAATRGKRHASSIQTRSR